MSIFTHEQAFIFVLFVFQLLKHSHETLALLGDTAPLLRANAPFALSPAGYGPVYEYVLYAWAVYITCTFNICSYSIPIQANTSIRFYEKW